MAPGGAVVVVAHPDDEALWFSSQLAAASAVVVAFLDEVGLPEATRRGRQSAKAAHPLASCRFLSLRGPGLFGAGRWDEALLEPLRMDGQAPQARFDTTVTALSRALAPTLEGATAVFTHAPWGEYGHEDHVLVHRAVEHVASPSGIPLWVPLYASARTEARLEAAARAGRLGAPEAHPTDVALAHRVRNTYRDRGCWTWSKRYRWPDRERFVRVVPAQQPRPVPAFHRLSLPRGVA